MTSDTSVISQDQEPDEKREINRKSETYGAVVNQDNTKQTPTLTNSQHFEEISLPQSHVLKDDEAKMMLENGQDLHTSTGIKWHNLTEAVRQELYPLMATSFGQSVDELMDEGYLQQADLSDEATDKVVDKLKKKKKLLCNNEIAYIKGLVKRARDFHWKKSDGIFVDVLFPLHSLRCAMDTCD